ncbi:tyrosine-type recombinase/integrase [Streptosporangiaceae bacterium NEAU-GS5]|nr:tyrosine-type recombinase/integrase [Streptosporangiaceae bacterium NEAU-GS5]
MRLLRRHEHGQDAERNLAAERWHETGYVFTRANGLPLRPDYLTHRFATLVAGAELPPIRLHDLRHGAATLALAAHTDIKVIQAMLGHSSIVLTCDTYTSVLPDIAFEAAEKTARRCSMLPGSCRNDRMTHV